MLYLLKEAALESDPDDISMIYFYHIDDAARQGQTGGYGLGLYLCKVITEARQGQLK